MSSTVAPSATAPLPAADGSDQADHENRPVFAPAATSQATTGTAPCAEPEEPAASTLVQVARRAAVLAVEAADTAMEAVCRSRKGNTGPLEEVMRAAHEAATEAERYAGLAAQDAALGQERALRGFAARAIECARRAQDVAGVEGTAAALAGLVERKLTAAEQAAAERAAREQAAVIEAEMRAETGRDEENRLRLVLARLTAEEEVPKLGWSSGMVSLMEQAAAGLLRSRDGAVWNGRRRVSRERTLMLARAGFLAGADDRDRPVGVTPAGEVALHLARLHPVGIHADDRAAYDARLAASRRRGRSSDDTKAAARRLPALGLRVVRRFVRPVTLAEQEARARQEAADTWEDEGGHCPGVQTPRPDTANRNEPAPAPVADGPTCPPGLYLVQRMSTRYRDWWGLECGRCVPGVRAPLPGEWDDKGDAYAAAYGHWAEAHRQADDALTADELDEVRRWPLSNAQRTVLFWAKHHEVREYDDGFWGLDVIPDRWDVNKKVARSRVTGLWAAGLLNVHPDSPGTRWFSLTAQGLRVWHLLWQADRQGLADPVPKDAALAPLPERSAGYPLLSEQRYFKGEERPAASDTTVDTPAEDVRQTGDVDGAPGRALPPADELLRRLFDRRIAA
ncbi:hypothetical protein [Streptomyces sp. NPDC050428]|uniref:hypothetical protein n=1 Tax=Streptomyces sp. NPDC050428 TaxID=3155757 RepID=UPI003432E8C0